MWDTCTSLFGPKKIDRVGGGSRKVKIWPRKDPEIEVNQSGAGQCGKEKNEWCFKDQKPFCPSKWKVAILIKAKCLHVYFPIFKWQHCTAVIMEPVQYYLADFSDKGVTLLYPLLQPGAAQNSTVQPSIAHSSLIQTNTAYNSPVQSSTAYLSSVKLSGAH